MRSLPDPGFAGDDGAPDARLVAALSAYDAVPDSSAQWHEAVAALQDARLLVPIVADETGERTPDGAEKSADMSAVLMRGRGGRTALLAFTGLEAMRTWDPGARPVPVAAPDAARAALQNGAQALVVDVAGPVLLAVEEEELREIARGHRLVQVGAGWGWVTAD